MTRNAVAASAVLLLGGTGGLARAEPATSTEAARLTAVFERYVGHGEAGAPGPVSVVPHGEGYTATFDLTRMVATLARTGAEVTMGDLTAELVPQADGRWHVTVDGFPPVGVVNGTRAVSFTLTTYAFDGVFDPSLQTFATWTTRTTGSHAHVATGEQPVDTTLTAIGAGTGGAEARGAGRADVTSRGTYTALDDKVTRVPQSDQLGHDAAPPAALADVKADAVGTTLRIEQEPVSAIDDLWQFLVAHPSRQALVDAQADLKTKLHAIIPLASAVHGAATATTVAASTPLGAFALDSLSEDFSQTTTDAKDTDTFALRFAGLRLPDGLAPPWAVPLIPTSLDLTQRYGPLATAAAMSQAIDQFDLSADKPLSDAQWAAISALATDGATLTIAPSTLATPTLTVKFDAEVHMAKPFPDGSSRIVADGLDKTIDAVRAAGPNDPVGGQFVAALMAAKALAKAEGPDSYSWAVVRAPGQELTINGTSLGAIARLQRLQPRKTGLQP